MSQRPKVTNILSLLLLAAGIARCGQTAPAPAQNADRAAAYYHFSLGHLYAELAGAYGNKGDYLNNAIENYRLALKADPGATFLTDELSDLYIQAGQTRTAVLEAEEAIRQNPDDLTARRILGRIYTRMIGDPQQRKINEDMVKRAIEQYRKVGEKEPSDLDTWLMLGRLYKVAQNSVDAEKAYRKALELDPNNEDAMTGLAMVYADLGDNKSASEMLRKVADKSPGMRTLTALAGTYEQMREYALAAESLKKALEFSPGSNPELKRALAQNLMLAEQYDEALTVYEEVLAEDPKDAQSQLRVSQIYRQKHDFAKAREASRKAHEIDPENLEVRFNDVNLFEAEGKTAEAITLLKDMLGSTRKQSYNAGEKANRVALLERLGVMYRSNEQPQEAVAAFREIGELDATLGPRVAAQVIETYRAAKEYAKAEREADEAAKKHPDDRTLRMVRASVLAETGKPAQAVEELKTLLDGKSDREIQLSIAQAHEKARNYAEMAKALEAEAREELQRKSDEAIYARRNAAVEQERKIKENELSTEIAVEEKKRQIREAQMDAEIAVEEKKRQVREMQMNADIALEQQRQTLVKTQAENKRAEADVQAYAIEAVVKPLVGLDPKTLLALAAHSIDPRTMVAMGFQEIAENAAKIGQLNITPDLLDSLLAKHER